MNEELQRQIERLKTDADQVVDEIVVTGKRPAVRDALRKSQTDFVMGAVKPTKGAISNKELEMFESSLSDSLNRLERDRMLSEQADMQGTSVRQRANLLIDQLSANNQTLPQNVIELFAKGSITLSEALSRATDIADDEAAEGFTQEDRENLARLQTREEAIQNAPLGAAAQELRMQGLEGDTELAHLRLGEVVLPPEFLEDEQFGDIVEAKFRREGINPELAVVGGIASLNPGTGLQQFFLKKLAKGVKKFVKKAAPVLQFVPGPVGTAARIYNQGKTVVDVARGKANPLQLLSVAGPLSTGPSLRDNFRAMATGTTPSGGGISDFFRRAKEYVLPGEDKVGLFGNITRDVGGLFGGGRGSVEVIDGVKVYRDDEGNIITQKEHEKLNEFRTPQPIKTIGDAIGLGGRSGLRDFYGGQPMLDESGQVITDSSGNPILSGFMRDREGRLSGKGLLGIGALAAGLGKLAYEDAKKQKGVPLIPLTTMSPTGRYNIEAEIARRMGQPQPNPVEFGLLPAGTLPVLSGGQPRMASLGGAIEELEGGMARGMMGGGIMAFANGGAVAMQKGGELETEDFPRMDGDINGPGTEQSDDIPAMLSDGEFVMTARAVRGAGSYEMKTEPGGIINLIPSLEEDRERGMDVMYKVMDTFSSQAKPS